MDQHRQLLALNFELTDVLKDMGRQFLLLFLEVVHVYFEEGQFEVAVEVADGLQLSSKAIIDQNGRQRFLVDLLHVY